MSNLSFRDVKQVIRKKQYPIFGGRDFDITLIGVRFNIPGASGQSAQRDDFNDKIIALYEEHGQQQMLVVPATTDPGLKILKRPVSSSGTAIMVPDHYKGLWKKGRHSKIQNAFRQNAPVTVYRDRDRDSYLDMGPDVPQETGIFWINLHPATYRPGGRSSRVGGWSAGCQVTQSWSDFDKLRKLRDEQLRRYGTSVTSYSLITRADF